MNLDAWNALPESYQKIVEIACGEADIWTMARAEALQGEAIQFHTDHGVTIHTWPDEFIEAFRSAWEEVAEEQAAANAQFKRVYDDYKAFREEYAKWREIGYLKQ